MQTQGADTATAPAAEAPLDMLGLTALVGRLSASLETRRQAAPRAPAPEARDEAEATPSPAARAERLARADEDAAARPDIAPTPAADPAPVPAPFAPPAATEAQESAPPRAFRPIDSTGDDLDEEELAYFSLPLAKKPAPFAAPAADDGDEPSQDDLDEGFSSLLDMKNPFAPREEFVRIEEPEDEAETARAQTGMVAFPGQGSAAAESPSASASGPGSAPAPFAKPVAPGVSPTPAPSRVDQQAANEALRNALATLQRTGQRTG